MTMLGDDLPRAKAWYVERLGYAVQFDSDWFVQLRAPDNEMVELGILKRDHDLVPQAYRAAGAGVMLTVVVDDVDRVHEAAVQAGDPIIEPPKNLFYGQRRMLLEDPNGMLVDVSSECDPDPQWLASLST